MKKQFRMVLMLLLPGASGAVAAGCYTVLRHPESVDLVAEEQGAQHACQDCHVDSEFYRDAFDPHTYGFGSYATYPGWSDYYFRPWWYKDYWYYGSTGSGGQAVETGGQHMWGGAERRTIGTGITTPVFPGGSSAPAAPSAGSSTSKPPAPVKPAEQKAREADAHRARDRRDLGTSGKPAATPPPSQTPTPADTSGGGQPR